MANATYATACNVLPLRDNNAHTRLPTRCAAGDAVARNLCAFRISFFLPVRRDTIPHNPSPAATRTLPCCGMFVARRAPFLTTTHATSTCHLPRIPMPSATAGALRTNRRHATTRASHTHRRIKTRCFCAVEDYHTPRNIAYAPPPWTYAPRNSPLRCAGWHACARCQRYTWRDGYAAFSLSWYMAGGCPRALHPTKWAWRVAVSSCAAISARWWVALPMWLTLLVYGVAMSEPVPIRRLLTCLSGLLPPAFYSSNDMPSTFCRCLGG